MGRSVYIRPEPVCIGCNKKPSELEEYIKASEDTGLTPAVWVELEEGTYNFNGGGTFLCTECYNLAGNPLPKHRSLQ